MARKANPTLIGAFVVGGVFLAVAALIVFGGGKFFNQTTTVVAYFDGSLKGMAIGAPVTFNGVKIGSVTDFKVVVSQRDLTVRTPVFFEIDADRIEVDGGPTLRFKSNPTRFKQLVQRGLRAQLELQSLVTGQLQIALNFFPASPITLTGLTKDMPEMPTTQSSMEKLSRTIENLPVDKLAAEMVQAVQAIKQLAQSPEIKSTIVAMNKAVVQFDNLMKNVNDQVPTLVAHVSEVSGSARATMGDVQETLARVAPVTEAAVKDYQLLAQDARKLTVTLDTRVAATLAQLQKAIAAVDGAVNEDSPLRYDLTNALKELQAAARSLRGLSDYLERHPEAVLSGKRAEGR